MRQNYSYGIIFGSYKNQDYGEYRSFGIEAIDSEGNCIKAIQDVTSDRVSLERLIKNCNKEKLNPCHLYDVVCDFLRSQ